jgi:beta-lactamase class A
VPRRATTYRSARQAGHGHTHGRAAGPTTLVALFAVIVVGIVWVADPALFSLPSALILSVAQSQLPGSSKGTLSPQTADARGAADAAAALQMGQVALPAATTVSANLTPSAIPTQRQWESSTPGLVIDPALAGRLDETLVGVDGRVSVAVKDLGSGRGAALDGDHELPSASLYKLPVLYSVFEAGLNMGEELTISDEARSYDAGTMELGVGETLTVAEALERMVTLSDNTSAVMLGSRIGSGRVNANIAALGMDTTHYSLERMTTSALDMLHFLDVVAQGKAVSAGASADMLHLLLRQRVNDRLPRLLPDDVQVAHKTGNLPGTVNDVGIVYGPSSTVGIAVLISDTTDETMAATAEARVAQVAYAYFADEPGLSGRPTIPRPPSRPIPPVWRQPNPPTPTPTPTPTPAPTPTATLELNPSLEPAPIQAVVQSTLIPTPARPATTVPTVAPTAAVPQLAPTQPLPTATSAPRPATLTPTSAPPPPPPTRAPTRPPAATLAPTPGRH